MGQGRKSCSCEICEARVLNVFHTLPPEPLAMFNQFKVTNFYKRGQIIFHEGNHPQGLYCIFSGKVKLYKTADNGRQQIVRMAQAGNILGYRSLFADEPYQATAEAMEDSSICFIEKRAFFPLISKYPTLAMEIIKKLAKELGRAEDRIRDLALKTADQRLAELLLMLKETYGVQEPAGWRLNISLSRQEIAEMIGTAPETVIRLLGDFRSKGLLEFKGKEIYLLDSDGLLDMAGIEKY